MKKQKAKYYATSWNGASDTRQFYSDREAWEKLRKSGKERMTLLKEVEIPINDPKSYVRWINKFYTKIPEKATTLKVFIPIAVGLASHKWTLT